MRTAIVSDLHLGTRAAPTWRGSPRCASAWRRRWPRPTTWCCSGDLLELRERPGGGARAGPRPLARGLGRAAAGKRVTSCPATTTTRSSSPCSSARARRRGRAAPSGPPARRHRPLAGRLARAMPDTEVVLAYPGMRLRPDVYATHGHYLDVHLTMPRLESVVGPWSPGA